MMKPPTPLIVHPQTLIPEAVESFLKASQLELCRSEGHQLAKHEGERVHFWDQAEYGSEDFQNAGLGAPTIVHALDERLSAKLDRIKSPENAVLLQAPTGEAFEGHGYEVLDWHREHEDEWGRGLVIATGLFHPGWYDLFDPEVRGKKKELAKRCLHYLQIDTILGRKGAYSYALEAYWAFYLGKDFGAIADRVRQKAPLKDAYQAHIGFILYFLGEDEKAREYLESTELAGLEKLEHIHFYGVLGALLEDRPRYEAALGKLPEYYFDTEGLDPQKHFFEALACAALGEEDRMLEFLAQAKESDALYEHKEALLGYVRGVPA